MDRRNILGGVAAAFGTLGVVRRATAVPKAHGGAHRLALDVDRNDPAVMNLTLGNAPMQPLTMRDGARSSRSRLLRMDGSEHAARGHFAREGSACVDAKQPATGSFSACNNTKKAMEKAEGKEIALEPGARIVPAGIVRLVKLQEEGWSYIKP